jgi:hypothetical protein
MRTTQTDDGKNKICGKCKNLLKIEEFPRAKPNSKTYKKYKDGIKPWCKNCYREYNNSYMSHVRKTNPGYNHYFKKYGITFEEYVDMAEQRNQKCDICGNVSDHRYKKLVVDHCHSTGKIRGLLCFSCNSILGNAKDNISNLQNAIKYLEKNN